MNKRLKKKMAKKATLLLAGRKKGVSFEDHLIKLGEESAKNLAELGIIPGCDIDGEKDFVVPPDMLKYGYHAYMVNKLNSPEVRTTGVYISYDDYMSIVTENIKYCHHCEGGTKCNSCERSIIDPRD